ncbi:MAG: NADPH-dependent F420 reductase [Thermomicrobiales bacterium]
MNIGILGAGMIGATTARLFTQGGHHVTLSNARGPASLTPLVANLGPNAHAATIEEAASFGAVVLIAAPFKAYDSLPTHTLAGKIVIDAMNYYPNRDGEIAFAGRATSEFLAQSLPGARIVKAFNTMYYETLASAGRLDLPVQERLALFLAGDDAAAKEVVAGLITGVGFAAVETGTLHESSRQEPGAPIYNVPMTQADAEAVLADV